MCELRLAHHTRHDRASCTNAPSARYPLRVRTRFSCAKALLVDGVSRQAGSVLEAHIRYMLGRAWARLISAKNL